VKQRLEARVYYKNRLICTGYNSYTKSSRLQRLYGARHYKPYVHAELDAIREACYHIGIERLSRCTLMIERIRPDGSFGMARPCSSCADALRAFVFKEVWFTNAAGVYERF